MKMKYSEKIKILTLVPDSSADFFCVSEYLVRTAQNLKQQKGNLANPECNEVKKLSIEKVNEVIQFYEDDEFSHQMPGKKDCISTGNKQVFYAT